MGLRAGGEVGHEEAMLRPVCLSDPAHDQVPVHPIHARQEDIQGQRGRGQDIRQLDGRLPPDGAFSHTVVEYKGVIFFLKRSFDYL